MLSHLGRALRCAFSPKVEMADEFRTAIREQVAAGEQKLLVAATITAALEGHNDVHRSVVEATERAGDFL